MSIGGLPVPVFGEPDYPEDLRLTYRFLDLRRETLHGIIMKRLAITRSIRRRMHDAGFNEFPTPILTASSPEGARDFLVPSRVHPGKFYALPQAPQQYKQLLMMSGFDRYFQIAPCFRDEDPRADRLPGEFYQLDVEMSFVEQSDVLGTMEPIIRGVFEEVVAPTRLSFTFTFVDSDDRPTANAMMPDWPVGAHIVMTVELVANTCNETLPPEVLAWFRSIVHQAVLVEFDHFIAAGRLADRVERLGSVDSIANLTDFAGMNL